MEKKILTEPPILCIKSLNRRIALLKANQNPQSKRKTLQNSSALLAWDHWMMAALRCQRLSRYRWRPRLRHSQSSLGIRSCPSHGVMDTQPSRWRQCLIRARGRDHFGNPSRSFTPDQLWMNVIQRACEWWTRLEWRIRAFTIGPERNYSLVENGASRITCMFLACIF